MPTIVPDQGAQGKLRQNEIDGGIEKEENEFSIAPLGEPQENRKFWFQRRKEYNPNAIATQPSVYDDVDIRDQYLPRPDWENAHRFDPSARWTWGEEHKVIRKIDWRIMLWVAVMFTAMELDRANLSQAVADDFLADLGFTTNDLNLGNSVYALSFLAGEFPSQLLAKWVGPDRYIPVQIILFSIVSASQFALNSKASFLACRSLLALLQGGFIPECVLYLSYFYKHHELTIRLSFFWTGMFIADILASIIAFGLLHLRGVRGYAGWRWLFLIEGLITGTIGIASFVMLPPGPTQTASWSRGEKGWFTPREESIMVNRIIRDDPSKGSMHNRQPITLKLLWQSLTDVDLWPLYAIGLTFNIPTFSPGQYLTLSLKGLGFTTFETNLLSIPYLVLKIINMMLLSILAEVTGQLAASAVIFQFWCLPFLVYLRVVDTTHASKWLTWAIISLLLAAPLAHPVQVGWVSRNANTVRSRAIGAALYNMFLQAGVVISSNIYRADDAPLYRRGNTVLLGILSLNVVLYVIAKLYYVWRNRLRAQKWDSMTPEERLVYLSDHQDKGNKRLDFRLAS
ncbi:major facilitator superfamily domain-containing protein [Xylaria bambusicola]|uniref:major facilitator superfamily domain-containing protein n=1 Tax=Xylaria bambusicola TaxID=326684 RepID=UPI002007E646|nr:major facilitator superfamily domain-containing protein [Xylaria bambusicola]KAI0513278.1 major facilitator superfamily domain-containing protein [Xylaria bambusicola]